MEGNSTLIIAIIIGVVIALLAVALFLLTRNSGKKQQGHSPLVERNPNYGSASTAEAAPKAKITPAPKVEKAAPSPLKPRTEEPKAEAPAAKEEKPAPKEEPKKVEAKKEEPKKAEPAPAAKKPFVEEEDDGWGDDDSWDIETTADIDAIGETSLEDDFSAGVKKQQEDAEAKPKKIVDRRSSEDDDDDWGEEDSAPEIDDGWKGPVLQRVSPEVKKAFKDASLSQEFHVSKRKEADDLIVKCVQAYLAQNEDPAIKEANERVFALHCEIQLSDLPEIVESFLDSGDEKNQTFFADFEDMCNTHEDSVLVLFEKFNTTLPKNLRCRRIAEVSEPVAAVIYLAPEWEDDDFDRPDFDERDEDIDEDVDYLEDFYDQLEDEEEDNSDETNK